MTQPPLLEAAGLRRHYRLPGGGLFAARLELRAVDGVDLTLVAGETLAVVGESGSGKSTLARLLTMLETPDAGHLRIGGIDPATATAAERRLLRRRVQMVFQNPGASLNPRKRIEGSVGEPLRLNTTLGTAERRERIAAMLQQVGLRAEHARRWPHQFSGGERQRIAIARALVLAPRLLITDEPTSALDVSVQAQILNLLMDLQQASGFSWLLISHNLAVVEHAADRVMVMLQGRIVETAPKPLLFAQPRHPYTRALLAATPRIDGRRNPAALPLADADAVAAAAGALGCVYRRRCPQASERCRVETPPLRRVGEFEVACHHAD